MTIACDDKQPNHAQKSIKVEHSPLPSGPWLGIWWITVIAGRPGCRPGSQQRILEHHLHHGRGVHSGGKACSICILEVECKGGVGGAGGDVHQVLVLLVLEELAIGLADAELWGGAYAQHAVQSNRA
jgi:hypothetical protein